MGMVLPFLYKHTNIFNYLFILIIGCSSAKAQDKKAVDVTTKGIQIGQQVPDITIANIHNYKTKTAKISDFKGKLLIIDFWATWCSSCIKNFPKMEDFQKKFAGKIQILASTSQNQETIKKFLKSHSTTTGKTFNVTTAVDDKILKELFPHNGIPHIVWIDQEGKVAAITGVEEVTELNITQILSGKGNHFKEKLPIDIKRPLFLSDDYLSYNNLVHYSIFTKSANPGLPNGSRLRTEDDIVYGRVITNSSLIQIYEAVARQLFRKASKHYSKKHLILNVADTTLVTGRFKDGKYDLENQYSYDFIVPVKEADSLYSYMLQDLNRYCGFVGKIENRLVRCYTLLKTKQNDQLKTAGGTIVNTLFYNKPAKLQNCPISYLVNELNSLKEITLPVVDETNYQWNIDIELSGARNLTELNNDLAKYDLQLRENFRVIPMLILSEKPNQASISISNPTRL